MTELNGQRIGEITDYMFLPDRPLAADATIVLGQTLWRRPFEKSVEIYKHGMAGRILFSGGFNPKLGGCEALHMRRAWEEMGYDVGDILVDADAKNTMENMQNSRDILMREGLLERGAKINVIAINYHMRRAVETLRHVFSDEHLQIGTINYPSTYCDRASWFHDPAGRSLMVSEMVKIQKYLGRR